MTPLSEISIRDVEKDIKIKEKDEVPKKQIEWIFRALDIKVEKKTDYTLEDIQRIIDLQYKKSKARKYEISSADI